MKLSRKFYSRDTKIVAKELLGKILVHKTKEGICKGKIVETEAYLGINDPGAIGFRKIKNIPKSLFNLPGHAFVYFTYGNHWMLNILAKKGVLNEGKSRRHSTCLFWLCGFSSRPVRGSPMICTR